MITDLGNSATGIAIRPDRRAEGQDRDRGRARNDADHQRGLPADRLHWAYDTYALARGTASTLMKARPRQLVLRHHRLRGRPFDREGRGRYGPREAAAGCSAPRVIPMDANDFSSFVLQAQASKAKVVGFATAGQAAVNAIKTANEFGLRQGGQTLAGLYFFITDVHSLGLDVTQDMIVTTAFYWDRNDESRAWSKRFFEKTQADADAASGRELFRRAALPKGGPEGRHRRNQRRAEGNERDAGRRHVHRGTAPSARTAGWSTTCTSPA